MARQGINTGSAPDAGDGDSLLIGALKINANFSELYTTLGDGTNITNSIGYASTAGIASALSSTANINTTGIITANSFIGDGSGLTGIVGSGSTANIVTDSLVVSGVSTFSDNIRLGNDDKIQFGNSQEFSIYYNSSQGENRFEPAGGSPTVIMGSTLNLESITGEVYLNANSNGAVNLYYDNAKKFETTTDGISVAGIVSATSFYGSNTLKSRTVVSATTGSIGAGNTENLSITGYKSYSLLKVGISSAAWVVLYTDADSRTSDASRSYLTDPTPGSGVIAEVRTTIAGISTFIMSPGIIGWNNDVSVGSTIYAKVTNNESSSAAITVDLTVVKLED